MKLIEVIQFNESLTEKAIAGFRERRAARAIVADSEGNIGVLFVAKHGYHKIPGGGIEEGEDEIAALKRECREEIGCNIEIQGELGEIVEYRDKWQMKQVSKCYLAKVAGDKGSPDFTETEKDNEFSVIWLTPKEALDIFHADTPNDYEGLFIQRRDGRFIKEYLKLI